MPAIDEVKDVVVAQVDNIGPEENGFSLKNQHSTSTYHGFVLHST
jgi:hypothetical protein